MYKRQLIKIISASHYYQLHSRLLMKKNDAVQDDFFEITEVSEEIPYKKIESLDILSVQFKENQYIIKLNYKFESLPNDEKIKEIKRKQTDIAWLLQKFAEFHKNLIIIPKISDINESYIASIAEKLYASNERKEIQKKYQKEYMENVLLRCLNVIAKISLPYMNVWIPDAAKPLFIFISPKYELYKNPLYSKEQPKTIGSFLNRFINQGINLFKSKQSNETKEFLKLKASINEFFTKNKIVWQTMQEYLSNLNLMSNNFVHESKIIKGKMESIYQFYFKLGSELNLCELQMAEIDELIKKCGNSDMDKSNIEQQLKQYYQFLQQEMKSIRTRSDALLRSYLNAIEDNKCQIKVYPDRQIDKK